MSNQDPRNIFVDQRNGYTDQPKETKQSCTVNPHDYGKEGSPKSGDPYAEKVAEMKRLAAKYEREGEGQLVKDIVNNVIEQKARGNLTNDQLIAFAKRVSPLLNSEQRSRLEGLLAELLKL